MIFGTLIAGSLRAQMQYRASFLMLFLSHFLATCGYAAGLYVLFDRFHIIQGWTLPEVSIIYGVVHISFGIAESFARGFEVFSRTLLSGEFDRILLRPVHPLVQIATQDVQLMRLSRSLQGALVLAWGLSNQSFGLLSLPAFILILSILGTTALFYGLLIIQAALSFWTIETLEMMNVTTYGGVQTGQYPMSVYDRPLRLVFTVLIPLACVSYYPIATALHHESFPIGYVLTAPLLGFVFLYCACKLWNFGARHYLSTGS